MRDYYRHKLENLLVAGEIVTIHRFEFDEDFTTAGEEHDFWELVYADRGEVTCTAAGKEMILHEGEMLFHAPGEFHTLTAKKEVKPRVLIVAFACASESMHFFESKKIVLPEPLKHILYEIVEEGEEVFDLSADSPSTTHIELRPDSPLGGKQTIKNLLELLLIGILRQENGKESTSVFLRKDEVGGRLARRVIGVLEKNVTEKFDVRAVCEAVNYGKSYVFRQFKLATGKSVMAYFTELKIERAKGLLKEDAMNVTEIAAYLGFDSPNYFTKTFRRLTGTTPTAWKRTHASE